MTTYRVTLPSTVKSDGSSVISVVAENAIIQEGCLLFFSHKVERPILTCAFAPGTWLRFSEVSPEPTQLARKAPTLWTPQ